MPEIRRLISPNFMPGDDATHRPLAKSSAVSQIEEADLCLPFTGVTTAGITKLSRVGWRRRFAGQPLSLSFASDGDAVSDRDSAPPPRLQHPVREACLSRVVPDSRVTACLLEER